MSNIVNVPAYAVTKFDDDKMELIRKLYQDGYTQVADDISGNDVDYTQMQAIDALVRSGIPYDYVWQELIPYCLAECTSNTKDTKYFNTKQISVIASAFEGWEEWSADTLKSVETGVSKWAKLDYNYKEMKQLKLTADAGYTMIPDFYHGCGNKQLEIELIRYLLKAGLSFGQSFYDVMGFSVPGESKNLNRKQIYEIKYGFDAGLTVEQVQTYIANGRYDDKHMAFQRKALCAKPSVDMIRILTPNDFTFEKYSIGALTQVLLAVQEGLSIVSMANPKFDGDEQKQIRLGLLFNKLNEELAAAQAEYDPIAESYNAAVAKYNSTNSQITAYTNQLNDLNTALDTQKALLVTAQSALDAATNDYNIATDAVKTTNDQVASAKKDYDTAITNQGVATTNLSTAKTSLDTSTAAYNSANSTLTSINSQVATLQNTIATNVNTLRNQLDALVAQQTSASSNVSTTKTAMDNSIASYNDAIKSQTDANALVNSTKQIYFDAVTKYDKDNADLAILNNQVISKQSDVKIATDNHSDNLATLQAELDKLLSDQSSKLTDVNADKSTMNTAEDNYETALSAQTTANSNVASTSTTVTNTTKSYNDAVSLLNGINNQVTAKQTELQNAINAGNNSENLDTLNNQLNTLLNQQTDAKVAYDTAKTEYDADTATYNTATKDKDIADKDVISSKLAWDNAVAEYNKAVNTQKTANDALNACKTAITPINTSISNITAQIAKVTSDMEPLKAQLASDKAAVDALQPSYDAADAKVTAAKKAIDEIDSGGTSAGASDTTDTPQNTTTTPVVQKTDSQIATEYAAYKAKISSGKTQVALAICRKGVQTEINAELDTMATNIDRISTGVDTTNATATVDKILAGYTAYSKGYEIVGTMVNNGAVSKILNSGDTYVIPFGFHDGTGKISTNPLESQTDATATADTIIEGYTAWIKGKQVTGTCKKGNNITIDGTQYKNDISLTSKTIFELNTPITTPIPMSFVKTLDNALYCYGGTSTIYIYSNNTWTQISAPEHFTDIIKINNDIFVIGYYLNTPYCENQIYKYIQASNTWITLQSIQTTDAIARIQGIYNSKILLETSSEWHHYLYDYQNNILSNSNDPLYNFTFDSNTCVCSILDVDNTTMLSFPSMTRMANAGYTGNYYYYKTPLEKTSSPVQIYLGPMSQSGFYSNIMRIGTSLYSVGYVSNSITISKNFVHYATIDINNFDFSSGYTLCNINEDLYLSNHKTSLYKIAKTVYTKN